jgi:hypothetical protein
VHWCGTGYARTPFFRNAMDSTPASVSFQLLIDIFGNHCGYHCAHCRCYGESIGSHWRSLEVARGITGGHWRSPEGSLEVIGGVLGGRQRDHWRSLEVFRHYSGYSGPVDDYYDTVVTIVVLWMTEVSQKVARGITGGHWRCFGTIVAIVVLWMTIMTPS